MELGHQFKNLNIIDNTKTINDQFFMMKRGAFIPHLNLMANLYSVAGSSILYLSNIQENLNIIYSLISAINLPI